MLLKIVDNFTKQRKFWYFPGYNNKMKRKEWRVFDDPNKNSDNNQKYRQR